MERYNCEAHIDVTEDLCQSMHSSVSLLEQHLEKGHSIYGISPRFLSFLTILRAYFKHANIL